MASNEEFVKYVADQVSQAGNITYKKMFGEYGMYCDNKIFALICENQFFVKITESGREVFSDLEEQPPYKGAKDYFLVEEIENREKLVEFVQKTCEKLAVSKPKKPKKPKDKDFKKE